MISKGQKFISLFLIISLLILPMTLPAKERRGANLIINKTDGNQVQGELIVVKQNSLLLKDSQSGADVTVDIKDVNIIKIVKKSKTLAWGSIGLVSGAVYGALFGYIEGDDPPGYFTWGPFPVRMDPLMTAKDKALGYGFYIGLSGAILGGIIGAIAGKDKIVQIEGKSDTEIKEILEDLRKKARVPDFQ